MKCLLKSSSASRGICPNPLAPSRSSGPMKASQTSSAMPIFGRSRAAGLRGWLSRYSSMSSFIAEGSSSIASEVTPKKRADGLAGRKTLKAVLLASPNHGDGSREAAAHVKGKKSFHVFDLAGARLFGELLVSLEYLADTGRADRMTITDQSTACVDRNFKRKF